ncbi:MAG: hypothetical protein ACRDS0_05845 [Pseudonocardiaceae bacterium]
MINHKSALLDTIRSLDEAKALEAAQLLASALDAEPVPTPESPIFAAPLEHRAEVAELCRLVLSVAATDPETQDLVEESIVGAGRKQLVLGGLEIVALATLALGALHVCISRGRTAEDETITVERRPDGTETTIIRRSVQYGVSGQLSQLVRSALNQQP